MSNDFLPITCAPKDRILIGRFDDGDEAEIEWTEQTSPAYDTDENYGGDGNGYVKVYIGKPHWVRRDMPFSADFKDDFAYADGLVAWRHLE